MIEEFLHSRVDNYAGIPGLTSWMIGTSPNGGKIRMFHSHRDHDEFITPHSHRFDFECLVVEGEVENIIFEWVTDPEYDMYVVSEMEYSDMGVYTKTQHKEPKRFRKHKTHYTKGERYSMFASDIHAIKFSRGAKVLFFESPQKNTSNVILEPYVHGECIPTFKVEDWMFKKRG